MSAVRGTLKLAHKQNEGRVELFLLQTGLASHLTSSFKIIHCLIFLFFGGVERRTRDGHRHDGGQNTAELPVSSYKHLLTRQLISSN